MTAVLFLAQRASAAVLAFAVTIHLATIIYAVRGGLTAAEVLGRTRHNGWFLALYVVFVLAVGKMVGAAEKAVETLSAAGLNVALWDVRSCTPLDPEMIAAAAT